jgi:hypothetical protein
LFFVLRCSSSFLQPNLDFSDRPEDICQVPPTAAVTPRPGEAFGRGADTEIER